MFGKRNCSNGELCNIGKLCLEIRIEWASVLAELQGLWVLLSGKYNKHIIWVSAGCVQQAGPCYNQAYGSAMPQLGDLKVNEGYNAPNLLLFHKMYLSGFTTPGVY